MAVLGRVLVAGAERLDLPDLLGIESFVGGDFKYLIQSLVGAETPYVLRGFDVLNPELSIDNEEISIRLADAVVYYPASTAGSFFVGLPEGNALSEPLVPQLRQNATNYVYVTFTETAISQDTRAFWDPDKDGGAGGEFTQDVNTETVLTPTIGVSSSNYPEGTIAICKVVVNTLGKIQSIQDSRNMMFRLGVGGTATDPFARYNFKSLPSASYERDEPSTLMTSSADPNPFQGGDKNIETMKEWMDVVMTKLVELSGTTFWYKQLPMFSVSNLFNDTLGSTFKSKGQWDHTAANIGNITWTEDIKIRNITDPREIIIRASTATLNDDEVLYADLQRQEEVNTTSTPLDFQATDYINGIVSSFENLKQGDWIRRITNENFEYRRVEQFYQDPDGAGAFPVTPATAQSIRLNAAYTGGVATDIAVYTRGIFELADLNTSPAGDQAIYDMGGDMAWLVMRDDTVMSVSDITRSIVAITSITNGDGSTARVETTAVHGLEDGDWLAIEGTANYDATYKIQVESTSVFYIDTAATVDVTVGNIYYATVTTQITETEATSGIELESANHGFEEDQTIAIAGTTGNFYNGEYQIHVPSASTTTFRIASNSSPHTANDVVSTITATLGRMYVRSESGVDRLVRGEIVNIGGIDTDNIRTYAGMPSPNATSPNYQVPSGYNTLEGMQDYNTTIGEDLTDRISKLTSMMANKAQDKNNTFVMTGVDRITNTINGSNQELTFTSITGGTPTLVLTQPGSQRDNAGSTTFVQMTITMSNTLTLAQNQCAYFSIDRDLLTSVAGIDNLTVANYEDVPVDENIFIFASHLADGTITLWDQTQVISDSTTADTIASQVHKKNIDRQNFGAKLLRGGTWSWDVTATNVLASNAVIDSQFAFTTPSSSTSQDVTLGSDSYINQVQASLWKTGLPSGTMICEVRNDNTGSPGATVYAVSDPIDVSTFAGSVNMETFAFDAPVVMESGTTYHLVFRLDDGSYVDGSNNIQLDKDTGSGDLTYSLDGDTSLSLTNDALANIHLPHFAEAHNQLAAQTIDFASDELVAHIQLDRSTGADVNRTITTTSISTLDPTLDTFIVARRERHAITVGDMRLIPGESIKLDDVMSDDTKVFLGNTSDNPIDSASSSPNYINRARSSRSSGQGLRTIMRDLGLPDAVATMDAEIDKFFGLMQIQTHPTNSQRVVVTGASRTMLDNTTLTKEMQGYLVDFDGAQIDFSTGEIFAADGTTPLGFDFVNFTPPGTNLFTWYSITAAKGELDNLGRRQLSLIAKPAAGAMSELNAEYPKFAQNGVPIGMIKTDTIGSTVQAITASDIIHVNLNGNSSSMEHVEQGDTTSREPATGFKVATYDLFEGPISDPGSQVDGSQTNSSYDPNTSYHRIKYDAAQIGTVTSTAVSMNNNATFTVAVNDIIYDPAQNEWRKIITVTDQQNYILDAAFTADITVLASLLISQAVWTIDLVEAGSSAEKTRPRDLVPHTFEQTSLECLPKAQISVGEYFELNSSGDINTYYVWFDISGTDTDPAIPGRTGIRVDLSSGAIVTGADVATLTRAAIIAVNGGLDFSAPVTTDAFVIVTNINSGETTDAANISVGSGTVNSMSIEVLTNGGDSVINLVHFHYEDSTTEKDLFPDQDVSYIAASATNIGLRGDVTIPASDTYSDRYVRPTNIESTSNVSLQSPVNKYRLFAVFFANYAPIVGTGGSVNLHNIELSFYQEEDPTVLIQTGVLNSAFVMSQASGVASGCTDISLVSGVSELTLLWDYNPGTQSLEVDGDLEVFVDGKLIPRYFSGVVGRYWNEVPGSRRHITFSEDLSTSDISIHVHRRSGVIDNSDNNALEILSLKASISSGTVVGSPAEVSAGLATHTSIQIAINDAAIGDKIVVLNGTYTEAVTVDKELFIEGKGHSAVLDGTLDFTATTFNSLFKYMLINDDITFANGSKDNIMTDCWQATGKTILPGTTPNDNLITVHQKA